MKRKAKEHESLGTAYQSGRPRKDGVRSLFRRPSPDEATIIRQFRQERHARFLEMQQYPERSTEHQTLKAYWEAIREGIRRFQRAHGLELDD